MIYFTSTIKYRQRVVFQLLCDKIGSVLVSFLLPTITDKKQNRTGQPSFSNEFQRPHRFDSTKSPFWLAHSRKVLNSSHSAKNYVFIRKSFPNVKKGNHQGAQNRLRISECDGLETSLDMWLHTQHRTNKLAFVLLRTFFTFRLSAHYKQGTGPNEK